MKRKFTTINIGAVAPMVLFAVFAVCILFVLLTGADVYKDFTDKDAHGNMERTAEQYLAARVRQSRGSVGYFVGDFDEPVPSRSGETYYIREVYGDGEYYTRVYCHNGYLYELFCSSGMEVTPADGERITELSQIFFKMESNILEVSVVYPDGTEKTLYFNTVGAEEIK